MTHRLYSLILIGLTVVLSFSLDWSNEIMNFSLAYILLISEILNFSKNLRKSRSSKLLVLKTNNWIGGLIIIAFLIYMFSDESMNSWNIAAIVGIALYGILEFIQNFRVRYEISEEGIKNLNDNKIIQATQITGIDFNNEQIAIHTKKYQNELIIRSSNVEFPDWNQLTLELSLLDK